MTDRQILLVKHSWSYVASQRDDVCKSLKKNLAFLCPEIKSVIKKLDREKRMAGLMVSVNQLVVALPDLQKAEKEFLLMLAEYADAGISKSYYDSAVIAFLMTLEKKIGRNWTQEMRDSWIFIFVTMHQQILRQLQLSSVVKKGTIL